VSDGPDAALAAARRRLAAEPAVEVDYLALVDDDTWHDADRRTRRGRLIVAARIGTTRLIDNTALDFEPSPS
jgi:pantoate--beta-alanine ligase